MYHKNEIKQKIDSLEIVCSFLEALKTLFNTLLKINEIFMFFDTGISVDGIRV